MNTRRGGATANWQRWCGRDMVWQCSMYQQQQSEELNRRRLAVTYSLSAWSCQRCSNPLKKDVNDQKVICVCHWGVSLNVPLNTLHKDRTTPRRYDKTAINTEYISQVLSQNSQSERCPICATAYLRFWFFCTRTAQQRSMIKCKSTTVDY